MTLRAGNTSGEGVPATASLCVPGKRRWRLGSQTLVGAWIRIWTVIIIWLQHEVLLFIRLRSEGLVFQKCSLPPSLSEVPGSSWCSSSWKLWFFVLSVTRLQGLGRKAMYSCNVAVYLTRNSRTSCLEMLLSLFSLGSAICLCGVGWPWLAAACLPTCSVTPPPQQDTGRSLTDYCHGQNRLDLGKLI